MKTVSEHIRQHLLESVGVFDAPAPVDLSNQWSHDFEELMRNRMMMGAMRYGDFRKCRARPRVRVSSMQKRLKKYLDTGNTEMLVDVANLAMIEFVTSTHHAAHFAPLDGDAGEDTRVHYG